MKAKPCPKCKSEDVKIGDCGYSSFNVAWVRCKRCQLEVKVNGDSAVDDWNAWAADPIGMLIKRVRSAAKNNRLSRQVDENYVHITEFAIDLIESRLLEGSDEGV